ncbi:SMP-30/gluconolactonase/LRE family protein [bacterium]|nr:SMP-30/gluconolactonase/LRE family protein [Opitutales bacterium]MDB2499434.1 SMP-30/gluconolactonase/LRE family protein [bacterium]
MKKLLPLLITLFIAQTLSAQDSLNFATIGEVKRLDSRLDALIPRSAEIEVLTAGFLWSEGPAWDKENNCLLFSDVHANRVYKWEEGVGKSVWMEPSGYTGVAHHPRGMGSNGLTFDNDGQLLLCEHGDRRISMLTAVGGKKTVVDEYKGKRFNSPNDLCVASNGDIYFTDPAYGMPQGFEDSDRDLDFCGVFILRKSGELVLLLDNLRAPNGICLSPDEKTLYVAVADYDWVGYMSYPVKENGLLGTGKRFYDATADSKKQPGGPDGIRCDTDGNLWATGPGGVYVFSPEGDVLGKIETGERIANCTFGDDGSVLYLTSDMYLCRIQTSVTGVGF